MSSERIVCDNNLVVSAMLAPLSQSAYIFGMLSSASELLVSEPSLSELLNVVARSKFNRYLSIAERLEFVSRYALASKLIDITCKVTDCRDPKDNKFLELALSGNADLIVTGDQDLLCLHPWRGIAILTPAAYLALGG